MITMIGERICAGVSMHPIESSYMRHLWDRKTIKRLYLRLEWFEEFPDFNKNEMSTFN
jgi:hypothetical protein